MNAYEQKIADRKERYKKLASDLSQQSDNQAHKAIKMLEPVSMGQPILTDHASAKSHRNLLERSNNAMRRSVALQNKSKEYLEKAETIGTGGISSDDPEALRKLTDELAEAKSLQDKMKQVNAIIRNKDGFEIKLHKLINLGYTSDAATSLIQPDRYGHVGYRQSRLTNNNAKIKRLNARITLLTAIQSLPTVVIEGNGYKYIRDVSHNRAAFSLTIPASETIQYIMKHHAFKWSPSRNAWVRKLTKNSMHAARRVMNELDSLVMGEAS